MKQRPPSIQFPVHARHTDEDAYLAGLFDGEGTITFNLPPNGRVRMAVSMTCKEPLLRLKRAYGGSVRGPFKVDKPNHKPWWRWNLWRVQDIIYALYKMFPFLTVKRFKAGWALEAARFFPGRRGVNMSDTQRWKIKRAHKYFHRGKFRK
jgi:hypothetical protein